tara:strand:- start:466 stop:753 length:288 start_codon:yes stop_codon:yes gene_type:complete
VNQYHCPYCSPNYQFFRKRADGSIICGQCGEKIIKPPLIKPVRIIAVIAVSAFISPLILLIINSFIEQKNQQPEISLDLLVKIQTVITKESNSFG